jgi:hypothetical protein
MMLQLNLLFPPQTKSIQKIDCIIESTSVFPAPPSSKPLSARQERKWKKEEEGRKNQKQNYVGFSGRLSGTAKQQKDGHQKL